MNQIYLGQRAYGFGAAAQVYFGKPLDQLTWPRRPCWPACRRTRSGPTRSSTPSARASASGMVLAPHAGTSAHQRRRARPRPWPRSWCCAARPGPTCTPSTWPRWRASVVVERFGEQAYTQGLRVHTSLRAPTSRRRTPRCAAPCWRTNASSPGAAPRTRKTCPRRPTPPRRRAGAEGPPRRRRPARGHRAAAPAPKAVRRSWPAASGASAAPKACAGPARPAAKAAAALACAAARSSACRATSARKDGTRPGIVQWPQADGAFVALDPASGRVRALVGGFDFNRQQFNHVTRPGASRGRASSPSCTRPRSSRA
jgi:penicillin-binding protein 1A